VGEVKRRERRRTLCVIAIRFRGVSNSATYKDAMKMKLYRGITPVSGNDSKLGKQQKIKEQMKAIKLVSCDR
jgi:hypothetical protein